MRLAPWIAQYYVAPLGEVLRSMMPLAAEVRRQFVYRIADAGTAEARCIALLKGGESSRPLPPVARRPKPRILRPQLPERRNAAKASALRSATHAAKPSSTPWCAKNGSSAKPLAEERTPAAPIASLCSSPTRASPSSTRIRPQSSPKSPPPVAARVPIAESAALRELQVPASTLTTLVKRGLVTIEDAPEDFHLGGIPANGKKQPHEHALNETQMEALATIAPALAKRQFSPSCSTASPARQDPRLLRRHERALDAGKSALLLVPEIGLTPRRARFAAFGRRWRCCTAAHVGRAAEQWRRIRRGEARSSSARARRSSLPSSTGPDHRR